MNKSYTQYQTLTLNGENYSKEALILKSEEILNEENPPYLKALWEFIKIWLDETPELIVKTSGSTGRPKKINFKKDQMVNSALKTAQQFQLKAKDKVLLCLPVQYIAGKMMVVRAFVSHLDLYTVLPDANPAKEIDVPLTFAAMLPFQFQNAMENYPDKLSHIRTIILGGAMINRDIIDFTKTFKGTVYETYGMTETLTHIAVKNLKTQIEFHALPGIKLSTDQDGNLSIMALHISNRWIQTNDVVALIDDSSFRLLGRRDNVINSGGLKLIAESLERKIYHIIDSKFFIAGQNHKTFGMRPVLVVEEKDSIDLKDLKPYFSKIEMPAEIIRVKDLYMTKNGKIDRSKNKKMYNLL